MSLIGIIQNAELDTIPGGLLQLNIAVGLVGNPGDTYSIFFKMPDGRETELVKDATIAAAAQPLNPFTQSSTKAIVKMSPLVFQHEGVHYAVVRSAGEIIHEEPFGVYKKQGRGDER